MYATLVVVIIAAFTSKPFSSDNLLGPLFLGFKDQLATAEAACALLRRLRSNLQQSRSQVSALKVYVHEKSSVMRAH